jgi:thiamine-monophosphate kinase
VGAELRADALPRSPAARDLAGARDAALAGGDDYELLFTAPPERQADLEALARRLDLPLTRIGAVHAEPGLHVLDAAGHELPVSKAGWQHF